jgi:hypothetical protein
MNKFLPFAFCLLPLLGACAQSMERRLDDVRTDFQNQTFERQRVGDRNLDPLLAGNALFQQDKFTESDEAFESINQRMAGTQSASILGEVGRAAAGNMAMNYRPYFMDDLFVSYYQLWAALATGRIDDARVIINQSYAKQQRLSNEYASLLRSREQDSNGLGAQMRRENAQWESFSDIMNPALTYLAGIYFLNFARNPNDFETARIYLSRADGMVPGNTFIRQDLAAARERRAPVNTTWIFIESGFAPKLRERRIDWPIIIAGGPTAVSVAVSEPVFFDRTARVDGAELVANVDAMFMTEYKEYQVNEALRALASIVSNLAVQRAANQAAGPLGGLAAVVATIAATSAEIRTWVTLPKRIYVLRVSNESLIELKSGGRVLSEIEIPRTGNHLIYIRKTNNNINPKIIKLKG